MYDPSSPFVRGSLPLQPRQMNDFAEERLRVAILWCELEPGETVTEAEIAERFGVGRAAARAAIGLVQAIPRHGWRIQALSGSLIGQTISARRLVEPVLAEARLLPTETERCRELVGIIATMESRGEPAVLQSARQYEREIGDIALGGVNQLVANFLGALWDQSERITRFLEQRGLPYFAVSSVVEFVDALHAGDGERIVALRRREVDRFENFVVSHLLKDESELSLPSQGAADGVSCPAARTRAPAIIGTATTSGQNSRGKET